MSEKYKIRNQNGIHFITITVVDWVDLFTRPSYKHIIADALNYCVANKGLVVYAYVIMSNHIHAIVSSDGKTGLETIIRDFKKHTSKQLIKAIQQSSIESRKAWLLAKFKFAAERIKRNSNYKIWQDGFHPIELHNNKMKEQRLNYIHENPTKGEIVYFPHQYKYSSALDYAGEKGVVNITLL